MMFAEISPLCIILPLASFILIIALRSRRLSPILAGLSTLACLAISSGTFYEIFLSGGRPLYITYDWIRIGNSILGFGLLIDKVSSLMMLIVSLISFLVVVYSVGYLHDDPSWVRYFAEVSLFAGSMMGLVMSSNLLAMFIFWELVGLCSYLLIGFWLTDERAPVASTEAFVVTRFADGFMMLGLVLLYAELGTLDMVRISKLGAIAPIPALLLLIGAFGKSAQIPFYGWLPDAMAAPTPISALLHSATMVKAGVYLVLRLYSLDLLSGEPMRIVAYIGCITALLAAIIASVEIDVKRVIAYSTVSHLALMMLAFGLGAFTIGYLHVLNHSIFKALLFLCAGVVMHTTGKSKITEIGGLARHSKFVALMALFGSLSLAGLPPFSGFFSKDGIFAAVLESGDSALISLTCFTVFLSSFYIFRWYFSIFHGREKDYHYHFIPEYRWMLIPLPILGILTLAVSGFVPTFYEAFGEIFHFHFGLEGAIALLLAILGLILAFFLYFLEIRPFIMDTTFWALLRRLPERAFGIYWLYFGLANLTIRLADILGTFDRKILDGFVNLVGNITVRLSDSLGSIDRSIVDGLVNLIASIPSRLGGLTRRIHTGIMLDYNLSILAGVILVAMVLWITVVLAVI